MRTTRIIFVVIIIPASYFVISKYKFSSNNKTSGGIRPYLGVGGGLHTAIFTDDFIIGTDEYGTDIGEQSWAFSFALLAKGGADIFLSGGKGLFIELRYVYPFGGSRNVRSQVSIVVGFKFL